MSVGPKIKNVGEGSDQSPWRHRPLVPVVCGLGAGIVLSAWLILPAPFWLCVAGVMGCAGAVSLIRGWPDWMNGVVAALLVMALGAGWYSYRQSAGVSPRLEALLNASEGEKNFRTVRARVQQEPELFVWKRPFGEQLRRLWRCEVELTDVKTEGDEWVSIRGGITVFGEFPRPEIQTGDWVEFPAELSPNRAPTNPGETDFRAVYRRRGSYGRGSVHTGRVVRVVHRPAWYSSPSVLAGRLRSLVKKRLIWNQKNRLVPLARALILGERGGFTRSEWRLMAEAGSIHFLAISGLHVGLFAGFVWLLLRWFRCPFRWRAMVLIVLVWGYVVFMGSPVSARRAGWMVTFVAAASLLHRRRDSVSAVLGAAFIILIMRPEELFSVGFQFTFTAVWALLVLYPQIEKILWPWKSVVDRMQQPSERLFTEDVRDLAGRYIALSVCVGVALMPLTIYHFHRFSILTPVINLVIWPLALLLIGGSFVIVPVSVILPELIGPMLAVMGWLSDCVRSILLLFSRLPGFVTYTPAPPVWWVFACYGVLATWAWRRAIPRGRQLFVVGVGFLALSYVGSDVLFPESDAMQMTLADVGHGQCAVFRLPDGRAVVYDAGSSGASRAHTAGELLWEQGIRRIGVLMISHRDSDHANFVPYLGRRFEIEKVLVPPLQSGAAIGPIEAEMRGLAAEHMALSEGLRLSGAGFRATCLHPDRAFLSHSGMDDNNCSAVMRCTYRGWDIVVTGDIGAAAIHHLMARHADQLAADVLVLPHHGAWADGLGELLRAVDPQVVLVSSDHELPARTAELLRKQGRHVWSTYRDGALILRVNRKRMWLEGYDSGRTLTVMLDER